MADQLTNEQYHREAYARSLDTIAVFNPSDEDFIMWDDKYGTRRQRVMVPSKDKDLGRGKGINHLPRYLAERYTEKMIVAMINEVSAKDWAQKGKKYRDEERSTIEENMAIRTNDVGLWNKFFPQIWKGVVEKYGGDTLPEPQDPTVEMTGDPFTDVMNQFDPDRPYEEVVS